MNSSGTASDGHASESTSASLIERARDADAAAWRRLSGIYGPLVYRWCRRAGLQECDAADVVQEVFRAVVEGLAAFQPGRAGGFRGWLYGVTRHKLADHFRRRPDHAPLQDGMSPGGELPEALSESPSDDEQAFEATLTVHAALDAIRDDFTARNWQAFERTALGDETAVDVAAQLGMTPAAVRQARFRILRRLRRELDELSPPQDDGSVS